MSPSGGQTLTYEEDGTFWMPAADLLRLFDCICIMAKWRLPEEGHRYDENLNKEQHSGDTSSHGVHGAANRIIRDESMDNQGTPEPAAPARTTSPTAAAPDE